MKIYYGKGNIGLLPGSLFNDFDCRRWWNSISTIKFFDGQFELTSFYENVKYVCSGKVSGPNYYHGVILLSTQHVGSFSFTAYTNDKGCVITGFWEEEKYTKYEVWGEFYWESM